MKRKSIELTFIFGFITLVQLISQIVIVRLFGASLQYDAFLAAVALPTVMVAVVYGTLNDAFLPIFAHKNKESESESKKYFSESITTLFTLGILFSFAVYILVLLSKNL
ncbi:MAG TPA: lipid II flippase MurJ, partial [Clostridia bacterium]